MDDEKDKYRSTSRLRIADVPSLRLIIKRLTNLG